MEWNTCQITNLTLKKNALTQKQKKERKGSVTIKLFIVEPDRRNYFDLSKQIPVKG